MKKGMKENIIIAIGVSLSIVWFFGVLYGTSYFHIHPNGPDITFTDEIRGGVYMVMGSTFIVEFYNHSVCYIPEWLWFENDLHLGENVTVRCHPTGTGSYMAESVIVN